MDGGGKRFEKGGGGDVKKSHVAHEQEVTDFGFSFNLLGGCSGALFVFFHVLLECHGSAWRVFLGRLPPLISCCCTFCTVRTAELASTHDWQ